MATQICEECGKEIAEDDTTAYNHSNSLCGACIASYSGAAWTVSTGFKLTNIMHREDVDKLKDMIKSMLPDYATPYPIWEIAASLARDVAETDWEKELASTTIEWNPERMFPSDKEKELKLPITVLTQNTANNNAPAF